MRRWLMGLAAVLSVAASAWALWEAWRSFWAGYGSAAHELAALKFLTGADRSGGVLGMNASDYLEDRAEALTSSAFALALAIVSARLGWLVLRRFRRGAEPAAKASRFITRLFAAAIAVLTLLGSLMAWMSFEYCSSWYGEDDGFMSRFDMAFVSELGLLALLGLLGAAWLLPRRSWFLVALLVLALMPARQMWGAAASGECLSLPGMLDGGRWVLRADQ